MPYNESIADRLRSLLKKRRGITEKSMFGGISFLLNGKMICGVRKDDVVMRVDPKESDALQKKSDVRPMDFTGRPMKGFLYIGPRAYTTDKELQQWLDRCLSFVSSLPDKPKRKKKSESA